MAKIYMIAGEPSGDYIGSCLIKSIKQFALHKNTLSANQSIEIIGVGGPLMELEGFFSLFNIKEISLMGFVEILPKFFKLKKLINDTIEDILLANPSLLITIDSPGFTYRVAKKIRDLRPNLQMIHIVAPSVWAYKPGRALKYAKIYNHLLTLLPFEPPYFKKVGLNSTCVGHFIIEQTYFSNNADLRKEFNLSMEDKILCITPGSRKSEIINHMPIFAEALKIIGLKFPSVKIVFVLGDHLNEDLISSYLKDLKLDFTFSTQRLKIFAISDVALAKSGTNTLEIAASKTPMIVAYKLNTLTFFILKFMIKVRYASLINIIMGKEIIPEYIQGNCNPNKIAKNMIELLSDPEKGLSQVIAAQGALKELGFNDKDKPSEKAAEIIISTLK